MSNFNYSINFSAIDEVTAIVNKINAATKKLGNGFSEVGQKANAMFHNASSNIQNMQGKLQASQANLGAYTASLISMGYALYKPIDAAIKFEEAMADVKKVVDATPAQFKKLEKQILDLSKTIPLLPEQISQIVASGGALGIPQDQLISFAETVAKAAVAFDMTAEVAGDAFASLSSKMGIPINKIGSLGDAINYLSNTVGAKAPAIIAIMGRLSGTLKELQIPPELGAGIAAFADKIFTSEEIAASGVQQFVSALARTNKELGLYTKLQKEGVQGFGDILKQLSKYDVTQLIDMFGIESARAIKTMTGSLDVYQKVMGQVADKTKYTGSMTEEFKKRSATTANAITLIKNSVNRLFISIGSEFLPVLNKAIADLTPFINKISEWVKNNKETTNTLIKIAGALALLTAASIAIKLAITPLILSMSILNFVLMANPITLIVMGVLAAVAAFAALVYWIDEATSWFNGLHPVIQALMIPLGLLIKAIKWIKDNWSGIANSVGSVTSKISGAWSSLTTPSNATDQHATINKMQSPIKGLESKSTVNVNLRAQGAQVTSVDKKTTGRTKLNVGTNTLGK